MSATSPFGDRFMVGVAGHEIDAFEREILAELSPIGLALKPHNILGDGSPPLDLIEQFRDAVGRAQVIVAVDYPMEDPSDCVPQLANFRCDAGVCEDYLGFTADLADRIISMGAQMLFGPPIDIARSSIRGIVGNRSLGETADEVTERGCRIVAELHRLGVLCAPFSFPGDGLARRVPGHRFPRIDLSAQEVIFGDLRPFAALIDIGVKAIQCSSVVFSGIDAERPATISPLVIKNILRDRLEFTGVVVSADLDTPQVSAVVTDGDIARSALEATVDLLLVSNVEHAASIANAMSDVVQLRLVSEEMLSQSSTRVKGLLSSDL